MADLVIKPATGLGNRLVIKDQGGVEVFTTVDSGATLGENIGFQKTFTASGAINDGDLVVLNSDGTASTVTETIAEKDYNNTNQFLVAGNPPVSIQSTYYNWFAKDEGSCGNGVAYDSVRDCYYTLFSEHYNEKMGVAMVRPVVDGSTGEITMTQLAMYLDAGPMGGGNMGISAYSRSRGQIIYHKQHDMLLCIFWSDMDMRIELHSFSIGGSEGSYTITHNSSGSGSTITPMLDVDSLGPDAIEHSSNGFTYEDPGDGTDARIVWLMRHSAGYAKYYTIKMNSSGEFTISNSGNCIDQGQGSKSLNLHFDKTRGKYIFCAQGTSTAHESSDTDKAYFYRIGTRQSDDSIVWLPPVTILKNSNDSPNAASDLSYDPDKDKYIFWVNTGFYYNQGLGAHTFVGTVNPASNSITWVDAGPFIPEKGKVEFMGGGGPLVDAQILSHIYEPNSKRWIWPVSRMDSPRGAITYDGTFNDAMDKFTSLNIGEPAYTYPWGGNNYTPDDEGFDIGQGMPGTSVGNGLNNNTRENLGQTEGQPDAAYLPSVKAVCFTFSGQDGSALNSNLGTSGASYSSVVEYPYKSTNFTGGNFLGISNGSYTNGQTATITLNGGIDDDQTGLVAGTKYYLQMNNTLATTPDSNWLDRVQIVGTAINATNILLGSGEASTQLYSSVPQAHDLPLLNITSRTAPTNLEGKFPSGSVLQSMHMRSSGSIQNSSGAASYYLRDDKSWSNTFGHTFEITTRQANSKFFLQGFGHAYYTRAVAGGQFAHMYMYLGYSTTASTNSGWSWEKVTSNYEDVRSSNYISGQQHYENIGAREIEPGLAAGATFWVGMYMSKNYAGQENTTSYFVWEIAA